MKMIALDLDGTLLNHDTSVSPNTKHCIQQLFDLGQIVSIVTGRTFEDTCAILLNNKIMPANGYPQYLICEERDIYSLQDGVYQPWAKRNGELLQTEREQLPLSHHLLSEFEKELPQPFFTNNEVLQYKRGFVEIVFHSVDQARDSFAYLESKTAGTNLRPVRNNRGIAIRHVQSGKRWALEQLADSLEVPYADVLAMGDSHNDLSMLSAGFNVATTANADDEVKEVVKAKGGHISTFDSSSGVADILVRLFSLKDVS